MFTTLWESAPGLSDNKSFYDHRYAANYMDDGSYDNSWRMEEFLRAVLPNFSGRALDFGTGNGRYAALLKRLYPNAEIFGVDISDTAVEIARQRHPGITFLHDAELDQYRGKFDLVLSNHVLEHVFDFSSALDNVRSLAAPDGVMIHTMPCGNAGSFERAIVDMTKDGRRETGAWFFEDPGHLRRVTSNELEQEFLHRGFACTERWFSGQYWGALEWITESPTAPFRITPVFKAKTISGAIRLLFLKIVFVTIMIARGPAVLVRVYGVRLKNHKGLFAAAKILSPLGAPMDWLISQLAKIEWKKNKTKPNGSGMFLVFRRATA